MSGKYTKVAFGKILGEIYRLQRVQGLPVAADLGRVYGLLNGIERAIDEEFESVGFVSEAQVAHAQTVLDEYFYDSAKLDAFKGFYDVEGQLEAGGVSRDDAISIFKYFLASRSYVELIERMDSKHSPIECKNFSLDEWSK